MRLMELRSFSRGGQPLGGMRSRRRYRAMDTTWPHPPTRPQRWGAGDKEAWGAWLKENPGVVQRQTEADDTDRCKNVHAALWNTYVKSGALVKHAASRQVQLPTRGALVFEVSRDLGISQVAVRKALVDCQSARDLYQRTSNKALRGGARARFSCAEMNAALRKIEKRVKRTGKKPTYLEVSAELVDTLQSDATNVSKVLNTRCKGLQPLHKSLYIGSPFSRPHTQQRALRTDNISCEDLVAAVDLHGRGVGMWQGAAAVLGINPSEVSRIKKRCRKPLRAEGLK